MKKIKIFNHLKLIIVLIILFLFSFFIRIKDINQYVSFHQDQVRDLLIIQKHFEDKSIPLLGPKASVGDFYLPPLWYYLMSISYFFSPSPLAPAIMTAFLNSLATVFIYLFVYKFFDKKTAVFSSLLYAVSPLSIEYSRFAWNPNPVPFFVILTFYFLFNFLKSKKEIYFILGTISANFTLQLHYQGAVIFIFYFLINLTCKKINLKRFLIYILLNIFLIFPFLIYEFKNNFFNINGILNFLTSSQKYHLKFFGIPFYLRFLFNDFSLFLSSLLFFKNQIIGFLGMIVLFMSLFISFLKIKKLNQETKIISFFLIFSFLILYIYKNSLINFYLLFLIPVVIIYFLIIFNQLNKKISMIVFSFLIIINLIKSPAFGSYDNTYLWLEEVSKKISQNKNYCIEYDIFKETFIENKLRYVFFIQKNKPKKNCLNEDLIIYFCEPAKCQINKFKNRKIEEIKFNEKYSIKAYKIK